MRALADAILCGLLGAWSGVSTVGSRMPTSRAHAPLDRAIPTLIGGG
ncbi:MAG: hypothetical protein ACT4PG_13185 [Panacagrimonas sp.]